MNILKQIEKKIESTHGAEQKEWVKKYEEYLSSGIQIDLIEKSNDDNPICYMDSEKGDIKYKNLNDIEKLQLYKLNENKISEIKKSILFNENNSKKREIRL
ncbi:hypothetical protein [Clostridium perfringens]|uniref:hypothetical protein n=1 Tax=Clostridium perfringens TaxID=1502 RepID=UPI0024BD43F7|nr:hypothetical protein [Clostridium perfringens]